MVDINKVKDIKVIYYVDTDDNIKTTLCAVPSDKDIRSKEVIEFIRCEIYGALSPILHVGISDCEELLTLARSMKCINSPRNLSRVGQRQRTIQRLSMKWWTRVGMMMKPTLSFSMK